ncbi:MAG: ATP-binding protein [Thermoanaerobaculia bacterium]|nr:ATP-binding protein [Thermoanaerobaculia bacterium]
MISAESNVHLVIGSQIENIELVQIVLEESLRKLEVGDDASHAISLAVGEAVANAIQHGNERDPGKRVEVDLALDGDDLVVKVADEGRGFDPTQLPDPCAPDNLLQPNGRGILFMNSYMDSIDYSFDAQGGTMVTLRKRLGAPRPEAPAADHKEMG